ncbi:hypothetical protein L4X63_05245 [Geomonas sp. Red32]|uniref:hypothetical protein n=1 Tax=Geomonas sp. Red32 TaxID=2912856 RepID=UPI00202CF78D|nr:hypothetical protein [Geomonas sp. Red32]MCM0080988.1 hypothetical protein [Geomonas sp. Red32]
MRKVLLLRLLAVICLTVEMGCASLLPRSKQVAESPWTEYADAKKAFDAITIGKTTVDDLKDLGFDIKGSPNIKVLNYLDIAANVQSIPLQELDPGLQACLRARSDCRAYVFEPSRINSKRIGSFWLDIFNFRKKTHETGWRFKALIVFIDHHVAYKLSSGEPQIDTMQDQVNPLGPLQSPAGIFTKLIPGM